MRMTVVVASANHDDSVKTFARALYGFDGELMVLGRIVGFEPADVSQVGHRRLNRQFARQLAKVLTKSDRSLLRAGPPVDGPDGEIIGNSKKSVVDRSFHISILVRYWAIYSY